jgi:hypothetical protein
MIRRPLMAETLFARIKWLARVITPIPWSHSGAGNVYFVDAENDAHIGFTMLSLDDARFVAEYRNALPHMMAVVEAAKRVSDSAEPDGAVMEAAVVPEDAMEAMEAALAPLFEEANDD